MELEEIERRFTYHPPKPGQVELYGLIRATALQFAKILNAHFSEGREKSLAFTKLEECVFHANSAVARRS